MDIGGKIKKSRTDAKITQEQAAQALGISRQTISNWENEQCHQLKTIDGLFYAKTVEMQPQLVGAGLCSARQNAVNSFENLRRIRKQLPLWM